MVEGNLSVSEKEIQCASLLLAVLVLTDLHSVFIYDSGAPVGIRLDAIIEASVLCRGSEPHSVILAEALYVCGSSKFIALEKGVSVEQTKLFCALGQLTREGEREADRYHYAG